VSKENAGFIVERGEYKGKPILVIKRRSLGSDQAKYLVFNNKAAKNGLILTLEAPF